MAEWFTEYGYHVLEAVGIVGGLLFSAYASHRDEESRRVANSIEINSQYRQIWQRLYDNPQLSRILSERVDFENAPITFEEELFVGILVSHLSTVFRAMKHGLFVELEGLRKDVDSFFVLPIPRAIWEKKKDFQDRVFVEFIEANWPKGQKPPGIVSQGKIGDEEVESRLAL
jgi:hypothetical protein